MSRGPPASAHGVGRTSSAGDYAWFDDNLFQLRPEDDTSTFRLHSSGGRRRHGRDGGGSGQDSSADASLRADFSSPDAHAASVAARTTYTASYHHATTAKGHTKGSYVRPGRTLRLGAAVAAGGANAQVGPIDVASLRTTYQGPDRVREKNRQRHRLRRAEKARSALIEAETIAAHRVQEEEAARLAAKDAAVSGEEEEDTRPASFSAAARLQKRKNGKDKSIRSRSGHDGGRVLTGVNAGASSLVATLLSPRSTASSSSRDVSSGAGGARATENESFASSFQTSINYDFQDNGK